MKPRRLVLVLLVACWAAIQSGFAGSTGRPRPARPPEPAHGGVIARAGARYLELVVKPAGVEVWLLDRLGATLPPVAGARIEVRPENKPRRDLALVAAADHLEGATDLDAVLRLRATVTIKLDGRLHRVAFRWGILNNPRVNDADTPLKGLQP